MRQVLEEWQGDISIGGRKISNLRYADNILIIITSAEKNGGHYG